MDVSRFLKICFCLVAFLPSMIRGENYRRYYEWVAQGDSLAMAQRFDSAIICYKTAFADACPFPQDMLGLLGCYEHTGDSAGMEETFAAMVLCGYKGAEDVPFCGAESVVLYGRGELEQEKADMCLAMVNADSLRSVFRAGQDLRANEWMGRFRTYAYLPVLFESLPQDVYGAFVDRLNRLVCTELLQALQDSSCSMRRQETDYWNDPLFHEALAMGLRSVRDDSTGYQRMDECLQGRVKQGDLHREDYQSIVKDAMDTDLSDYAFIQRKRDAGNSGLWVESGRKKGVLPQNDYARYYALCRDGQMARSEGDFGRAAALYQEAMECAYPFVDDLKILADCYRSMGKEEEEYAVLRQMVLSGFRLGNDDASPDYYKPMSPAWMAQRENLLKRLGGEYDSLREVYEDRIEEKVQNSFLSLLHLHRVLSMGVEGKMLIEYVESGLLGKWILRWLQQDVGCLRYQVDGMEGLAWQICCLHGMKENRWMTNPVYVQALWNRVQQGDIYPYAYAIVYDQHYGALAYGVRGSYKKMFSMYGVFGGRDAAIPEVESVDERRADIHLAPLWAMRLMYGIPLPAGYEDYLRTERPDLYKRIESIGVEK